MGTDPIRMAVARSTSSASSPYREIAKVESALIAAARTGIGCDLRGIVRNISRSRSSIRWCFAIPSPNSASCAAVGSSPYSTR